MTMGIKGKLGLGIAAISIPGAALAWDPVPGFLEVHQSAPAAVEVRSTNGQLYNDVVSASQVEATADGACEVNSSANAHAVESLKITAEAWPNEVSEAYLDALAHHANELPEMKVYFPGGIYPDGVSYPSTWRDRAIAACNTHLNHQIDVKGLSQGQVLAKQWNLKKVPLDDLHGALACGSAKIGGGFTQPGAIHKSTFSATMNVRCLKYSLDQAQTPTQEPEPPGATDNVKNVVGVTQASLTMVPDNYQGACPAQINVSGVLVTNGPTKVRYRLEDDKGQLSPVGFVTVDQTNTAYFNVKVAIGKAASTNPQGTYGAAMPAGGGASGPSSTNSIASEAPPPNVFQGFYRLLTVEPNEVVSKPSGFKVTCNASSSAKLKAPSQPPTPLLVPAVQKMPSSPTQQRQPASAQKQQAPTQKQPQPATQVQKKQPVPTSVRPPG